MNNSIEKYTPKEFKLAEFEKGVMSVFNGALSSQQSLAMSNAIAMTMNDELKKCSPQSNYWILLKITQANLDISKKEVYVIPYAVYKTDPKTKQKLTDKNGNWILDRYEAQAIIGIDEYKKHIPADINTQPVYQCDKVLSYSSGYPKLVINETMDYTERHTHKIKGYFAEIKIKENYFSVYMTEQEMDAHLVKYSNVNTQAYKKEPILMRLNIVYKRLMRLVLRQHAYLTTEQRDNIKKVIDLDMASSNENGELIYLDNPSTIINNEKEKILQTKEQIDNLSSLAINHMKGNE